MNKGRQFKGFVLLLLCLLVFGVKVVHATPCEGVPEENLFGGPECDNGNGSECPACGGGSGACCTYDNVVDAYCCADLASVPELPSWFGPFFLATLVAGWEYWRVRRRKIVVEPILKK